MTNESTKILKATLLLLGTIIGAGIFAVPSMIGAWGIFPSTIAFMILTSIMVIVHSYYGEAILCAKQKGHLIGRATYWLGPWAGRIAGALQSLQIFGSCLAYLILGGVFLSWIGSSLPVSLLAWQCVFWALGALVVLYGLKAVARAEAVLTWGLIAVIVVIILIFGSSSHWNLIWVMPVAWNGFEPYGVFLFSLLGLVGMSEAAEIVEYKRSSLRKAIILSTILAASLTYLYGVTAWVASNGQLTRDASDVVRFLPSIVAFIVPLFGFLAVITSFISSALDLRNLFEKDMHATKMISWIVALGVPLVLLFMTPRDFMSTVGFVGSFFGAGIAIIVIWMGAAAIRQTQTKGNSGTIFLQTRLIPWLITIIFVSSGIMWLIFPSIL
jgi:amino acid permease